MKPRLSIRAALALTFVLSIGFTALGVWLRQRNLDFVIAVHPIAKSKSQAIHINHLTAGHGQVKLNSKRLARQLTDGRQELIMHGPDTFFGSFLNFPDPSKQRHLDRRALVFLPATPNDPLKIGTPYGDAKYWPAYSGVLTTEQAANVNFWQQMQKRRAIKGLGVTSIPDAPGKLKLTFQGTSPELHGLKRQIVLFVLVGSFDSLWEHDPKYRFENGAAFNAALNEGIEFSVKATERESFWIQAYIVGNAVDWVFLPVSFQYDPKQPNLPAVPY